MKAKTKMGKMVVKIYPVSKKEYDKIVGKIEWLCLLHGKKYHAKYIPNGGKETVPYDTLGWGE